MTGIYIYTYNIYIYIYINGDEFRKKIHLPKIVRKFQAEKQLMEAKSFKMLRSKEQI